jgi:hypothetical protein
MGLEALLPYAIVAGFVVGVVAFLWWAYRGFRAFYVDDWDDDDPS